MRFTPLIAASALFAGLCAAAPSTAGSLKACADAGIDPYGPIPDDYTKHTEGLYHFDEGSKAATWVRAQLDVDASAALEKRQGSGPANIGIGLWAQDWCTGAGVWADDVNYNVNYYDTIGMYSVGISYRGLRSNEHLDFSLLSGSDWCGSYKYSAGYETGTGCWNSQEITCFRLWTS